MLLTALAIWWIALTLTRGYLNTPYVSHYLYVSVVLIVLVSVEFFRDRAISYTARRGVIAVSCLVTVLNAVLLVHNSKSLRHNAAIIQAEVGALELARNAFLDPGFKLDSNPLRAPTVIAGPYFAAVDKLHSSPAPNASGIAAQPEYARAAADNVLIRALKITPLPYTPAVQRYLAVLRPRAPGVIHIEQSPGGSITRVGRCVRFVPAPGRRPSLILTLPAVGVIINSAKTPVQVRLRLFAHSFSKAPQAVLGGKSFLPAARGRASRPWHLLLVAPGPVDVC
jgi:hypothetical protein